MAVCVILGAGPGVGNSVAKAFLDRGYHVALCARDENKLANLAAAFGDRASIWKVDVSDQAALRKTLDDIGAAHGEVEVLHFNAFTLAAGAATELDAETFNESMQINITSALVSTQAVIPSMIKNGKGTVLFTGGGFALQPFSDLAALSVGKAGLRALAHCLHQELKSKGVHVGTVTICGTVQPGTDFDPDLIAKAFVRLHDQPKGAFEAEIMFAGD